MKRPGRNPAANDEPENFDLEPELTPFAEIPAASVGAGVAPLVGAAAGEAVELAVADGLTELDAAGVIEVAATGGDCAEHCPLWHE